MNRYRRVAIMMAAMLVAGLLWADVAFAQLFCPSNISFNTTPGQCGALVPFQAPAGASCNPPSGSFFPVAGTTVTCSDGSSLCQFIVTVLDVEAPTLLCPADIVVPADPGEESAVVDYGAPSAADNCGLLSVSCSPASGSVFPVGHSAVSCQAVDTSGNRSMCSFAVTVEEGTAEGVETLSDAILWIGLKNSDDQGTRFDVKTEVYLNDTLISEGLTRCITGVTRNPSKALEVSVPFGPIMAHEVEAGDLLSLKILTRIGTNPDDSKCPGHNNAVGLRLYYDAQSRASHFGAEIAPDPLTDVFLHSDGTDFLDALEPTAATAKFKDSSSLNVAGGNPWKEIGTWSMSLTVP
jgi:hypothetical protein